MKKLIVVILVAVCGCTSPRGILVENTYVFFYGSDVDTVKVQGYSQQVRLTRTRSGRTYIQNYDSGDVLYSAGYPESAKWVAQDTINQK